MHIERILLLEDHEEFLHSVGEALIQRGYDCDYAKTLEEARKSLQTKDYDLILADIQLPDGTGIDLLREQYSAKEPPLFIMMSGQATLESAIEAMRFGAANYLIKPFGTDQLELALKQLEAWKRLVAETRYLRHQNAGNGASELLLGNSQAMQDLRHLIQQISSTDATVLIDGESGTGKEMVAQSLVNNSSRSHHPYIKLNCAAIPENLIESEFFGHEKGAFTGAVSKRIGRFETADGGTLLLDEISEIPLPLQAKLLRVLQEREFERLGGSRSISLDIRILATTNRDLKIVVKEGKFREDLFYRLNVVPIHVPPLRNRAGDVDVLVDYFLKRFSKHHGKSVPQLSSEALEALHRASWPGNVRELQNSVERAVILSSPGQLLKAADFGLIEGGIPPNESESVTEEDYSLQKMEKHLVQLALKKTQGNVTHAAKLLGISTRTLHYKLSSKNASSL